ncbi:hypothetical protein KK062_29195 [Fulvivirgaceae bacterium PWU5]|uniref:Uncharacterized protein n=1 Tax=Dawidia cretensis TaxID=2782350 RepID=A0AAP2E3F5_9BACT|nr:hypothetical protein [Dawidia cretensis]MBT1712355.1 hypothetical protein [Dawidia cretensis]
MIAMDLVLSYDHVFSRPRQDIKTYLADVPKKGALYRLIRWLNNSDLVLGDRNTKSERQMEILLGVLQHSDMLSYWKVRSINTTGKDNVKCVWLLPHTALTLIEYLLKEHHDEIFSTTGVDIDGCLSECENLSHTHLYNILRAYFFLESERGRKTTIKPDMPFQELVSRTFTERMGTYELERGDELLTLVAEYQKAIDFYRFMETAFPRELELFLAKRQIDSWKPYVVDVAGFALEYLFETNNVRVRVFKPSILPYYDLFVNHESYRSPNVNFRNLKEHPLLKYGENGFFMIFRTFLFEKIFKALFFEFQEIAGRDIKSEIGLDFFERTLCANYISTIFSGSKVTNIPASDARFEGVDGTPDHYTRNWNNVFVFEAKDVLITDAAKTSMDNEAVKKEIENKFVKKERKGRPAGVSQLGNFIKNFEAFASKFDPAALRQKITFYPILVVQDRVLTTMGVNHVLDDYFQKELTPEIHSKFKIKPLIVIHIDCLILYSNFFSGQPKNFQDCLDDYLKFYKESRKHGNYFSFDIWMRRRYLANDPKKSSAANNYFNQLINQPL